MNPTPALSAVRGGAEPQSAAEAEALSGQLARGSVMSPTLDEPETVEPPQPRDENGDGRAS